MNEVRSVCPYCGVGCGIVLSVEDGRVVKVAGDPDHPSNRGRLCTKGSTSALALRDSGRMEAAFVRTDRQREPVRVEMDAAIAETARRLKALRDAHGPDAIALYVSGQMSLEAQYLANKLAKGYIGTNQIESNSRLCMASAGSGYKLSLGSDAPPGSYEDFDQTDLFFVIGSNMADCHPILYLRMMDRVKAGARLIVVDPRRTATAEKADLHLPIRPGTDLALLNGLLNLLHTEGHTDPAFIAAHTDGWAAMPDFLADYPPDRVAAVTGLPEAGLRQAARLIGEAGAWMSCWTMGLNQSTHGTANTHALCNLHLATGAICRPGAGPFSLTGQPNAMGGREMGYMGPGLPGQRSVLAEADRAFVESAWGVPAGTLHTRQVGGTVAMFERMAAGDIKACWIICTNPVASVANRANVIAGLQKAELVVAQDAFLDTETNRYADILLPGALWAEADGVMINSERTLTLSAQAVAPPGQALPDWQIIARVACAMGYADAFSYASAAEVFEEIKHFWNPATGYDLRGASHARLRHTPLQWPCGSPHGPARHPIRYRDDGARLRFATPDGKAVFLARPHVEAAEQPDADYPFVLNTGRLQHQWHTLTKTGKIAALNRLNPGPFVELHPHDAAALGIRERDRVELRSRRGRVELPAVVTDRVQAGQCFAPFHWNDLHGEHLAVNAVTSDAVDPVSLQPELKCCAVAVRRVAAAAPQPVAESRRAGGRLPSASGAEAAPAVVVLWASQTGRAEGYAQRCADALRAQGWAVAAWPMDACTPDELDAAVPLLLVTSTFGDGDPPDQAIDFWRALQGTASGRFDGTRFAVLAFGDSSYGQFCGFGRRLDAHLESLGAQRVVPRADCEPDDDARADDWMATVTQALSAQVAGLRAVPRVQPVLLGPSDGPDSADRADARAGTPRISRQQPLHTQLLRSHRLNGEGAAKETRQFVFDLAGSGLHYRAGDALGVWPTNDPALVEELLQTLGLSATAPVRMEGGTDMPMSEALQRHREIARITPDLLAFVAERSSSRELAERLHPDQAPQLKAWLWGRQIVDLLRAYPVRLAPQDWVDTLRRLQPRLYSIASSPEALADEVHLTVSVVRYQTGGRSRGGVCSTYLADRAMDGEVPIFVQPSAHFHPPQDPDTPMIMIGPGTGVAPFRGFLQERRARGARGRNWLFFGEQHAATDYYYRDELETLQREGVLTDLSLAFSRDQDRKIYVQDRMREAGARLWSWLQDGAHLYVCGDASRMAKDVDATLRALVQTHGGLSSDAADDYVSGLTQARRYLRDVY